MILWPDVCRNSFWYDGNSTSTDVLPCFGSRDVLELHTYAERGVYKLKIHSCNKQDAGSTPPYYLSATLTGKAPGGSAFISSPEVPIDFPHLWDVDTFQVFEINIELQLAEVTLVTLSNRPADDSQNVLCVDLVSVNGDTSRYISNHWIGVGTADSTSLMAVCLCMSEPRTSEPRIHRFLSTRYAVQRCSACAWTTTIQRPTL